MKKFKVYIESRDGIFDPIDVKAHKLLISDGRLDFYLDGELGSSFNKWNFVREVKSE